MISNMKPLAISFLLAVCLAASAKDKAIQEFGWTNKPFMPSRFPSTG